MNRENINKYDLLKCGSLDYLVVYKDDNNLLVVLFESITLKRELKVKNLSENEISKCVYLGNFKMKESDIAACDNVVNIFLSLNKTNQEECNIWRYKFDKKTKTIEKQKVELSDNYKHLFKFYVDYTLDKYKHLDIKDDYRIRTELSNAYYKAYGVKFKGLIVKGYTEDGTYVSIRCNSINSYPKNISGLVFSNSNVFYSTNGNLEEDFAERIVLCCHDKSNNLRELISEYGDIILDCDNTISKLTKEYNILNDILK